MRRRSCSLTENLEPRLVLSPLSLRGGVDPPRDTPVDTIPREEITVVVAARDGQISSSQRLLIANDVRFTPVPLTPVDSSGTGTTTPGEVVVVDDEPGVVEIDNVRTTVTDGSSSDGGSVDDDLAGDSLSTDDRTSVLVDSISDADGIRTDENSAADETVDAFDSGIDSSSESSPGTSITPATNFKVESAKTAMSASGIRDTHDGIASSSQLSVPSVTASATESSTSVDMSSWISSLTQSMKSWFSFEGLGSGTTAEMADSSVPYVALAGGFSLLAVGRKGLTEADMFEADDSGIGLSKPDRRSGRVTDRRRFRWFGFATKDRRSRPSGEVSREQPSSKASLSEPDISEAFAMSLMQSVGEDAFVLSPMPGGDDSGSDAEDSSLSLELFAAGAITIAGGTVAGRSRRNKRQTGMRPTIDYSGTTRMR
jgi:hypothetical protein